MKKLGLDKLIEWDSHYTPTLKLYGVDILKLTSPCVYGWQRGNTWLYIGMSMNGFTRTLATDHHVLRQYEILPSDDFYLWHVNATTQTELRNIEQSLILLLEPLYNKQGTSKRNLNIPTIAENRKRCKVNKLKAEAKELLKLVGE